MVVDTVEAGDKATVPHGVVGTPPGLVGGAQEVGGDQGVGGALEGVDGAALALLGALAAHDQLQVSTHNWYNLAQLHHLTLYY